MVSTIIKLLSVVFLCIFLDMYPMIYQNLSQIPILSINYGFCRINMETFILFFWIFFTLFDMYVFYLVVTGEYKKIFTQKKIVSGIFYICMIIGSFMYGSLLLDILNVEMQEKLMYHFAFSLTPMKLVIEGLTITCLILQDR